MANEITGNLQQFSTLQLNKTTSVIESPQIYASIAKTVSIVTDPLIMIGQSVSSITSVEFEVQLVYFVEIQSAIQRDESFVDIIAKFVDFAGLSTTLNSIKYSADGGSNYFDATAVPNDPLHTMVFPFIANGSTKNFVWDAQTDLGNGYFENVKFKIDVTNSSSSSIDIFDVAYLDLIFGLGYFPPSPKSFKVFNVDDDPTPKVETSWQLMLDSNLRNNYLIANNIGQKSAESGVEPDYLSGHTRTVEGYCLYRNPTIPFSPPGEGTQIADEAVLTSAVSQYSDETVSQGDTKHYKIATVINI